MLSFYDYDDQLENQPDAEPEEPTLPEQPKYNLANAADEILPMKDPRVQSNPSYLTIILLSRVVTKLGELHSISPGTIEKLFVTDLTYLQELYRRLNGDGNLVLKVKCPHCGETFDKEITAPGE